MRDSWPKRYLGDDIQSFDFIRQSGNELEDMLLVLGGRARNILESRVIQRSKH